jgi:hypothetical protein
LAVAGSAAANPPVLASVSGTCDPSLGSDSFSQAPLPDPDIVNWSLTSDAGPISGLFTSLAGAGKTFNWGSGGVAGSGYVSCPVAPSPVHYRLDWYAEATPPFSFDGVLPPGDESYFAYRPPEPGRYRVNIVAPGTLTTPDDEDGGDATFTGGGSIIEYASAGGSVDLANSGSTSTPFSVSVAELPPEVTFVETLPRYVKNRASLRFRYTVDRSGRVAVRVSSASRVVRTIVDGLTYADEHTEFWNWNDDAGNPLPEGVYTVTVSEPSLVGTGSASRTVTFDGAPPTLDIVRPTVRHPILSVSGTDAVSGVAEIKVTVDGSTYELRRPFKIGWPLPEGPHTMSATYRDRAGNAGQTSLVFTVPTPLSCSRGAGSRAAHGVMRLARYRLLDVACGDLTKDRIRDMAVLLGTKRGPRTPLAIFRQTEEGKWELAYLDKHDRFASVLARGGDVIARRARGKHALRVHWTGSRFKAARG